MKPKIAFAYRMTLTDTQAACHIERRLTPLRQEIHCQLNANAALRKKLSGFTLVELLITLAISGILLAIALPAFQDFIAGQRIKTASFDIIAMLSLARSEAIKRGANVTVNATGTFFTVTALDGTELRKQETPANVTITGGGTVVYNSSGRLVGAFTPMQLSGVGSTSVRCISIDLSGRPNSKATPC